MKTVSPAAKEIFSSRRKMISPNSSHSCGDWSVVKPSSARRPMRRCTGSAPTGDSRGRSAFSCIFVDQTDEVGEFKRFAEEVVGAALAGLLFDVAVAGEDDVRDAAGLLLRLERVAEPGAAHPSPGEVGADH